MRVLTYHRFGNTQRDPFCVPTADFENQMSYLSEQNLLVSLDEFERHLRGESPAKDGSVLVTIDDGFHSLYTEALPILVKFKIPAVAFITPSLIGSKSRAGPERYMTWSEVERLAQSYVTIGSHAWTHRSLGRLTTDEVKVEATRSLEVLEAHVKMPVRTFAYPFGTLADFNRTTTDILSKTHYTCAFTSQHGPVLPGTDCLTIPRIKVEGGEKIWLFRLLVRGGLDGWRFIDRTLWRLQATGNV